MKKPSIIFERNFEKIAIILIILYTLSGIIISVFRVWQFQINYFDYGIVDRAIWLYSRFRFPLVDHILIFKDVLRPIWGDHFAPSYIFFAPLYWITNHKEILVVVQSLFVGLGSFVCVMILRKFKMSGFVKLTLIVALLGYVGLQNAIISEFHDATLAVLPISLIFWSILNNKRKVFFVSLLFLLGLKETFFTLGISTGLFMLIKYRTKRLAWSITTILISLLWGLLAIYVVIPYFSGGEYLYINRGSVLSVLSLGNLIFPVIKIKTVFYSLLSFGFLPIFYIPLWPAFFIHFLERFTSSAGSRWDLGFHYNAPLDVLLFLSSAYVMEFISRKSKKIPLFISILIILIIVYLHQFKLNGPFKLIYNPAFYSSTIRVIYLDKVISEVPNNGTLMTQNDLAAQFTHRNGDLYLNREKYMGIKPDYILINLTDGLSPISYYPIGLDATKNLKTQLTKDKAYGLKKYGDEIYLFTKR